MIIQHFYDESSGTLSYVVADTRSGSAAVFDCVLAYAPVSGGTDSAPCDSMIEYIREHELTLQWILETHAHADHLSGAQYIKSILGGRVAIGAGIHAVRAHFAPLFNLDAERIAQSSEFDHFFADGETFAVGGLQGMVMATPGHTSDSVSYRFGSAVFVGDSLFMPDYGTARCDFPGGDAGVLYDSIQRLLALPDDTRLHMCHDYKPGGRELRWECTVAEQREKNIHVRNGVSKDDFAGMRAARDAALALPALIVPAIQVNIRAGHLPAAEDNGIAYIKTPINQL